MTRLKFLGFFELGIVIFINITAPRVCLSSYPQPALITKIHSDSHLPRGDVDKMIELIKIALGHMALNPPISLENNLLDWKSDDRSVLDNKEYYIHLFTSKGDGVRTLSKKFPKITSSTGQLFTSASMSSLGLYIFTVIFVDRVFYKPGGKWNPDALSELLLGLPSSLYCGVQTFLTIPNEQFNEISLNALLLPDLSDEICNSKMTIEFLESIMKNSAAFASLPVKVQLHLKGSLPKYQRRLQKLLESQKRVGARFCSLLF